YTHLRCGTVTRPTLKLFRDNYRPCTYCPLAAVFIHVVLSPPTDARRITPRLWKHRPAVGTNLRVFISKKLSKVMQPLLEARQLCVDYPLTSGITGWLKSQRASLRAVNNVSFGIHKGQALGVVGESGCGKSTLGRALIGFEAPSSGEIRFADR